MPKSKSSNQAFSDSAIARFFKRLRDKLQSSFVRFALIATLIAICIATGMTFIWLKELGVFDFNDRDLQAILEYKPHDNTIVYDRHGQKIGEFFTAYYIFTPYDQIPKMLIDAVTAIEDRNFYEHSGIDLKAIVRAGLSHLRPNSLRQGASTITQQLVRNFLLSRERTIDRKVREITLALLLEKKLSKEQIMELYLNALFLGNGAYGVGAAAQRYFGKRVQDLESHEMALIAGLFQSPSAYNPHRFPKRAKKRQLLVIRAMVQAGKITMDEAREMARRPLKYQPYHTRNFETAPYFVDYVRDQTSLILGSNVKNRGLRIYTTLDSELQKMANESLQDAKALFAKARMHLNRLQAQKDDAVEAAMVVTDVKSNQILAMFGGRDYSKSQFNRAVQARRAPGSAFKPIVYSLALELGYRWSDVVYISPVAVDDYRPRNFSHSFLSEATLLRAFYQSINTPVVELGQRLGLNQVLNHAEKLGIKSKLRREAGTLLGSSEVSLLEMATVFASFANSGLKNEPVAILKITDRQGKIIYEAKEPENQEVISPQNAYLMTEGMRSVFKFGTAYRFHGMGDYVVGKTGTTNDARDNWFCGYSSDLVTIVWMGTDDLEGFQSEITANTIALPLWAEFMKRAAAHKVPAPFVAPPGIVSAQVNPNYGHLDQNGVIMYFIEGEEPKQEQSNFTALRSFGGFRNLFDR